MKDIVKKYKFLAVLLCLVLVLVLLWFGYREAKKIYHSIGDKAVDNYKNEHFEDMHEYDNGAQLFKAEYEFYNGKENGMGDTYRTVSISEDNPMVYSFVDDIIRMTEAGESFAVYFGYPTCPWCRLNIESILKAAEDNQVDSIYNVNPYYIRDSYVLEDGKCTQIAEGTEGYQRLLEYFNDVLSDYTLEDDEGNEYQVGEKRIYVPAVIVVRDGEAAAMADTTDQDGDPYDEADKETIQKMYETYDELFKTLKDAGENQR